MNDEPMETSFKELTKKKIYLTENLKQVYNDGLAKIHDSRKHKNDPRFDPRVNGVCYLDDWKCLESERTQNIQNFAASLVTPKVRFTILNRNYADPEFAKLKLDRHQKLKKLLRKHSDSNERNRIMQALRLLKQRTATDKDRKFRKQILNEIQKEQVQNLKAGKRVNFLRRAELKELIRNKRLQQMNKKHRERYVNRKKQRRPHSNEIV